MKLLELQTTTEELSILNNNIYHDLVLKFNSLFTRRDNTERAMLAPTAIDEDSQFYKNQVELVGSGLRTKATVLYVVETGLVINHDPVISLTLRFNNKKNGMQEITAKTVVSKIAIPKPADIITIAYNKTDLSMIAVL